MSHVQAASNSQIPHVMTSERKRHARLAISAIFFVNGMVLATWVSRIPAITDKLGLSNGSTGTALMAIAAGSMIAFPIVGRLLLHRSSASMTIAFALVLAAALPGAALAPSIFILIPALL